MTLLPVVDVDVAVVGAGPAGLAAARESALGSARTVLLDSSVRAGGQYYRQPGRPGVSASPTQKQGRALIDQCLSAGVEPWLGVSVWTARHQDGCVDLDTWSAERGRVKIRARCTVIAVGAYERFVPIPGWTLPGVLSAGGVQTFLKEQGLAVGSRVVLGGTGPLQLVVAAQLVRSGVDVPAVFELARPMSYVVRHPLEALEGVWGQWARLQEGAHATATLSRHGSRIRTGWTITEVLGSERVEAVRAAPVGDDHRPVTSRAIEVACDAVALHHSLVPNTELLRLLGVDLEPEGTGQLVARRGPTLETSLDGVFAAGDGAGVGGLGLSLVEGAIAGHAAAEKALGQPFPQSHSLVPRLRREQRFQRLYAALFPVPDEVVDALGTPRTTVCRCEGVTVAELDAAIAEGARTSYLAKAVTRAGMGSCQGRLCTPAVEARLRGAGACPQPQGRAVRPPLTALPMQALRGALDGDD